MNIKHFNVEILSRNVVNVQILSRKTFRVLCVHLLFCCRFAEFVEGSPHLTEGEVMEYSHWEYNTDDEDGEDNEQDIYTDDEEADAASDEHQDY